MLSLLLGKTKRLRARTVLVMGIAVLAAPHVAWGYTSEHPEVKAMVKRAATFLQQKGGGDGYAEGGAALIGLALLKAGVEKSDARIQLAAKRSHDLAQDIAAGRPRTSRYSEALCCFFLCELDPEGHRSDINIFINGMLRQQQQSGCWGYTPHTYDDTSQTQYGVLCLWAAHHHKIPVPANAVERAANWLMRTQDPNGGWAYQARDAGGARRVSQGEVTHSMSAAGLSSLYICSHLMGFTAQSGKKPEKKGEALPPAVQAANKKKKEEESRFLRPQHTSRQAVESAQALGNAWFDKNLTYDIDKWTHYYMYGVERYKSFQEFVEGKVVPEPQWYNDGVEYLKRTQSGDGSWKTKESHGGGPPIDTAFAVLFLTRSSKTTIQKAVLNEGVLWGGQGLPKNLTNVTMQDGQVVTPQMIREMDEWLEMLEGAEDKEFDPDALSTLPLDEDLTERTSQLERLRKLVSNDDYKARRVAVKTLASARELDNVPILIYALTDKDSQVPMYARDGLRFISRKFTGFGMPDLITKDENVVQPTPDQKQAAAAKWKKWYLSIRPDGELLD